MTNYSYSQLETLWIDNGGNKAAAAIAAAIAMAESGGDSTAVDNDANGTTDRGLWQINSTHGAQSTFDVNANAKAAISISNNGTNWQPWTTFVSGAYKKFLSGAAPSSVNDPTSTTSAAGGLGGILSIPTEITGFFSDADKFVNLIMWLAKPQDWLRIGAFFIGGVLIFVALYAFIKVGEGDSTRSGPTIPIPIPVLPLWPRCQVPR